MMKALYKHIAIKPDYSDDSFITIPEGRDYYNVLVFIRRSSILRNGATLGLQFDYKLRCFEFA